MPEWDIDASPDRPNIERVIALLSYLPDVPPDAIAAFRALLARAETAEQSKRQRKAQTDHGAKVLHVASGQGGQGGYERQQPLVEVSFNCRVCGKAHTVLQLPGKKPTVCLPNEGEKQSVCQRQINAERVARWREKYPERAREQTRRAKGEYKR